MKQSRDIKKDDLLEGGLFRKCNTKTAGGGYDKFSEICLKRLGKEVSNQFVVQLNGCPLACPYCYVTPGGVHRIPHYLDTDQLISSFKNSGQEVFHLMGGAPALYVRYWHKILNKLPSNFVFHSDFILVEGRYKIDELSRLERNNALYAVNIKGLSKREWRDNTGVDNFDTDDILRNIDVILRSGINFYLTFTACDHESSENILEPLFRREFGDRLYDDSFDIKIIQYKALEE
jgi:pyruvate-formate lyase-activating enzyme